MPSSCAALLLLFPVRCRACRMRCFSCSPLCRLNGVSLVSAGGFSMSSPSSSGVMKLPCASSVARFTTFFQLAQVAWPRIALECFACRRVKIRSGLRSSSRFAWSRKKLAKSRMSSRRSFRSGMRRVNSLMRVVQVFAESPFGNALFQVFVGGTDKAYVHFDFFGRTRCGGCAVLAGHAATVFVLRSSGFLFRPERVCLRLLLRKHPPCRSVRPVNEPFTCPKNSDAARSLGIEPQSMAINGLPLRLLSSWMRCATYSLPVPLAPFISTDICVGATRRT